MIARDVPASVFYEGFPEDGQRAARMAWFDGFLPRVVVTPRLTLAAAHRLGSDMDRARLAYLREVGWTQTPIAPDPALLKQLSREGGVLPSFLWALPISEFLFNARILLAPEPQEPTRFDVFGNPMRDTDGE